MTHRSTAVAGADILQRTALALAAATAFFGPPAAALGEYAPRGGELRVNTYTTSSQRHPDVASSAKGAFIVVWDSPAQDGSGYGVYAQRYGMRGLRLGGEFKVNALVTGDQDNPFVAMNAAGAAAVVWTSTGQDGSADGVYARMYDASGMPYGSEFRVNSTTAGLQSAAGVAMDAAGNFVVVWRSDNQDGSGRGVYAQRFTAAGNTAGSEFRVNTTTSGNQTAQAVAMDADGDFVVVWNSSGDGHGYGIDAQRFDAAGVAQGGEFRVNGITTGSQKIGDVAMDAVGNFVVAWSSGDGNGYGAYARRFSTAGVAAGDEFLVNTTTLGTQSAEDVAMDADGDFVVSWSSDVPPGALDVLGRRFRPNGDPVGPEFRVNTHTADIQSRSAIAMDADGDSLVAWSSANGQDGSADGIYRQRYNGAQPVDLALAQTSTVDPAPGYGVAGGQVTYEFTVTNEHASATTSGIAAVDHAIGAASAVRVVQRLGDGASLDGYSGTGWSCTPSGDRVQCEYLRALLAGDTTAVLSVTLNMPATFQKYVSNGSVFNAQSDPDRGNNNARVATYLCDPGASADAIDVLGKTTYEGESTSIQVVRSGGVCTTASVDYRTVERSATAPEDYVSKQGTLTWHKGEQGAKHFKVEIVDDGLAEPRERVGLRLSNGGDAALGGDANLYIRDQP